MTALLYRDIESIGRLAVVMLVVVLATVGWVIVAGLFSFSLAQAFDFPPEATRFDAGLLSALGAAAAARDVQLRRLQQRLQHRRGDPRPERTMPRAIVLSIVIVVALYVVMTHRHPRHDAVAGSARIADDRVGVHRADVRGSRQRPGRRHRDDRR